MVRDRSWGLIDATLATSLYNVTPGGWNLALGSLYAGVSFHHNSFLPDHIRLPFVPEMLIAAAISPAPLAKISLIHGEVIGMRSSGL